MTSIGQGINNALASIKLTYQDFFTDVLHGLGLPVTQNNLNALYAVSTLEGLNGRYNPLNSTVQYGTSTVMAGGNSAGVQDYQNFTQGVNGTITLLQGSYWNNVVSSLAANSSTEDTLSQFAAAYRGWGNTAATGPGYFPMNPGLGAQDIGNIMGQDTGGTFTANPAMTDVSYNPGTTSADTPGGNVGAGLVGNAILPGAGFLLGDMLGNTMTSVSQFERMAADSLGVMADVSTGLLWLMNPGHILRIVSATIGMILVALAIYLVATI